MAVGGTHQLKDRFNAQRDAARILMIVSPTCPDCLAGMSVVVTAATEARATRIRFLAAFARLVDGPDEA